MGFPDYLLIVADYINWAKDQGISVGPGRGSGAGSIVCYAIRITNLDPLEFDLLFERFLNPDRISMPDLDIDFNDARRVEVIEYVRQKYGDDKVAMIATFGTMASKACLKDVARVMGLEYAKVDKVSKLIPIKFGKSYSLEQARDAVPDIQQLLEEDQQLREAYEFALKLEGLTRHASVHAAGVVIGRDKLTDLVPLMRDTSGEGIVCQYDMKAVEDIGLIKMDFLGLRTLSFLDEARKIMRDSQGLDIDFDSIPFVETGESDERAASVTRTFELMSRGETKRRVPARRRGHRRRQPTLEAQEAGRHHRAFGPVPPRPDGKHSHVCPAASRAGSGGLRARRLPGVGAVARQDPEGNLRHSRLSGTDHADRLRRGGLFAGRSRSAAPRDGQERRRRDDEAAADLRGRGRKEWCFQRRSEQTLRSAGCFCELRLQ